VEQLRFNYRQDEAAAMLKWQTARNASQRITRQLFRDGSLATLHYVVMEWYGKMELRQCSDSESHFIWDLRCSKKCKFGIWLINLIVSGLKSLSVASLVDSAPGSMSCAPGAPRAGGLEGSMRKQWVLFGFVDLVHTIWKLFISTLNGTCFLLVQILQYHIRCLELP
jgi:hypothetical protein